MEDRTSTIEIAGKKYKLLLTTAAVKAISRKFGGLENVEEELKKDYAEAIDSVCWLISTLANQYIYWHNTQHRDDKHEDLTPEMVENLTLPFEIIDCKEAIADCFNKGMSRNVKSEEEVNLKPKKAQAAVQTG